MAGPVIMVCGFGRCGSSLAMQMLHAAGVPMYGDDAVWPSFEAGEAQKLIRGDLTWLPKAEGRAVKVLDLHRGRHLPGPPVAIKAIWLDREPVEQARSHLKFLAAMLGQVDRSRAAVRAMARSIHKDRPRAQAVLATLRADVLRLDFEDLLASPVAAAERIARHVGGLAVAPMADCVVPRAPECLPYMLEGLLLTQRPAPRRAG